MRLGHAKLPGCVSSIRNRFPSGPAGLPPAPVQTGRSPFSCLVRGAFPTAGRSASRNADDENHDETCMTCLAEHHRSFPFRPFQGPASAWPGASRISLRSTACGGCVLDPPAHAVLPWHGRKGKTWRCGCRRHAFPMFFHHRNNFPVDGKSVSCPLPAKTMNEERIHP